MALSTAEEVISHQHANIQLNQEARENKCDSRRDSRSHEPTFFASSPSYLYNLLLSNCNTYIHYIYQWHGYTTHYKVMVMWSKETTTH